MSTTDPKLEEFAKKMLEKARAKRLEKKGEIIESLRGDWDGLWDDISDDRLFELTTTVAEIVSDVVAHFMAAIVIPKKEDNKYFPHIEICRRLRTEDWQGDELLFAAWDAHRQLDKAMKAMENHPLLKALKSED